MQFRVLKKICKFEISRKYDLFYNFIIIVSIKYDKVMIAIYYIKSHNNSNKTSL